MDDEGREQQRTVWDVYLESKKVVDDLDFWEELGKWKAVMKPVHKYIRLVDSDVPCASKQHYKLYEVQQEWEQAAVAFDDEKLKDEIMGIHYERWVYGCVVVGCVACDPLIWLFVICRYTCIQGAGYLLDPEFWDMDQETDDETMEAFRTFVDKAFLYPQPPCCRCTTS